MLAAPALTSGQIQARARESKVRIESALRRAGLYDTPSYQWEGLRPYQDLGVALYLAGALTDEHDDTLAVFGELGLDGTIHPIRGLMALAQDVTTAALTRVIVPHAVANEARHAFPPHVAVHPMRTFASALELIRSDFALRIGFGPMPLQSWVPGAYEFDGDSTLASCSRLLTRDGQHAPSLSDHFEPCGAILKAGKVLVLQGNPGAGATMIARRMVKFGFGSLTYSEAMAQSRSMSDAGLLEESGIITRRPFRAPHHTCSARGLQSECELAQYGVLFLDGLEDFSLEALRVMRRRLAAQATVGQRAALVLSVGNCMCRGLCTRQCHPSKHADFLRAILDELGFAYEIVKL